MTVDAWADLGGDLEAACSDIWPLMGVPERAPGVTLTHGTPVYEHCDQLWIDLEGVRFVAQPAQTCAVIPRLRWRIELARCWPQDEPDDVDDRDLAAAAAALQVDASTLLYGLSRKASDGTLFRSTDLSARDIVFGEMRPVGPSGGIAGWSYFFDVDVFT